MKALEKEITEILSTLDKAGALPQLMLVGSWCMLFYRDYFQNVDYHPTIRTTDIDFLVPRRPILREKIRGGPGSLDSRISDSLAL